MRAIWLENQTLTIRNDLPNPECGTGEALVQVCIAGICSTDLELMRGYYPFTGILGHEFVGKVINADDPSLIGTRITGEINISCDNCDACRRGNTSHCDHRKTIGINGYQGCFAEFLTLPINNLHRIPDILKDEDAVFAEPLAAALQIQQQVQVKSTDRVLVIGAGRLGQLIAQTLVLTGCDLKIVVRHRYQRKILNARGITTIEEREIKSRSFDLVIEASGSPAGFRLARQAICSRGVLVLKSTYTDTLDLNISSLVVDEITMIGSRCGPFEPSLRLMEAGMVNPKPLIMGRYPLKHGLEALEHAGRPGILKILLDIS
jgi:2-desacetyl-2-hydroxyethyl bacteriochlorophyllide A dehydrogenase